MRDYSGGVNTSSPMKHQNSETSDVAGADDEDRESMKLSGFTR